MDNPVKPRFPEELRAALRRGTSSKWAADLNLDDLPALIWMVGEFGRRAGHVLAALEEHWSAAPPRDPVAAARAKLALEGLFRFFSGDRPSEAEYFARWHRISERAWAAGLGRAPELPAEEMGDLWPVVWKGQFVGSLKDPRHWLFESVGTWAPAAPASDEFASALAGSPQTPVIASVGGAPALIEQPPGSSGDLKVIWLGSTA